MRDRAVVLRRLPAGADDTTATVNAATAAIRRRSSTTSRRHRSSTSPATSRAARATACARASPSTTADRDRTACCPSLNGTDPAGTQLRQELDVPELVARRATWTGWRRRTCSVGIRGGYSTQDQHDTNVTEEPRSSGRPRNNIGLPRRAGQPAARHRTSRAFPSNHQGDARPADARLLPGRRHGLRQASAASTSSSSASRPTTSATTCSTARRATRVTIRWNAPLATPHCAGVPDCRGTYGYYSVRSNGVDPRSRASSPRATSASTNIGLFVQDAWTINNKLTVNAGVRTERERVPTYTAGADIPGVRHRVRLRRQAGAARRLRLRHQGRRQQEGVRFVGHVLRHLQARTAARLVRRRQVARVLLHARHLRLADPRRRRQLPAGLPGHADPRSDRLPSPSFGADAIEPDLKPMQQQEATVGLDHQLNDVMAVSVRYVHKQIDRAIEDTRRRSTAGRQRDLHHRQPGRGPHRARRSRDAERRAAEADARLRRGRVRLREALLRQLVPPRQLPVEPSLWQLLGPVAVGRERPHQPERRPPLSTTR